MNLLAIGRDTTIASYWLNGKVFVCAIWILISMTVGSYVIWKYEGSDNLESEMEDEVPQGTIYHLRNYDDTWKPCIKGIHPIWLLAFRIIAFFLLLLVLILYVSIHGLGSFYFYTQWTFTLLTFYFGFGCVISIYGCYKHKKINGAFDSDCEGGDGERGSYVPPVPPHENNTTILCRPWKKISYVVEDHTHDCSEISNRIFQILFQISGGAVILTDCVYWFILFPLLTMEDYSPNFLTVTIHSLNALLILGDTFLNSLWFPWFRISYFVLWTSFFVIFQWILHGIISIRWPYPFMDLSLPYAPLWYIMVGLMHIPCYGIFALIVRLKYHILCAHFPRSYYRRSI